MLGRILAAKVRKERRVFNGWKIQPLFFQGLENNSELTDSKIHWLTPALSLADPCAALNFS